MAADYQLLHDGVDLPGDKAPRAQDSPKPQRVNSLSSMLLDYLAAHLTVDVGATHSDDEASWWGEAVSKQHRQYPGILNRLMLPQPVYDQLYLRMLHWENACATGANKYASVGTPRFKRSDSTFTPLLDRAEHHVQDHNLSRNPDQYQSRLLVPRLQLHRIRMFFGTGIRVLVLDQVTPDALQSITPLHFPALAHLDINQSPLAQDQALALALRPFTTLRKVSIAECPQLTVAFLRELLNETSSVCTSLEALSIHTCANLRFERVQDVERIAKMLPKLDALELDGFMFSDQVPCALLFEYLSAHHSSLSELAVMGVLGYFGELVCVLPTIRRLNLRWCAGLANPTVEQFAYLFPHLEALDLSNTGACLNHSLLLSLQQLDFLKELHITKLVSVPDYEWETAYLPNLRVLDTSGSSGPYSNSMVPFHNLDTLVVPDSHFSMENLGQRFTRLRVLNMNNTDTWDLSTLAQLPKSLQVLRCKGLSGDGEELVKAVAQLEDLRVLEIGFNANTALEDALVDSELVADLIEHGIVGGDAQMLPQRAVTFVDDVLPEFLEVDGEDQVRGLHNLRKLESLSIHGGETIPVGTLAVLPFLLPRLQDLQMHQLHPKTAQLKVVVDTWLAVFRQATTIPATRETRLHAIVATLQSRGLLGRLLDSPRLHAEGATEAETAVAFEHHVNRQFFDFFNEGTAGAHMEELTGIVSRFGDGSEVMYNSPSSTPVRTTSMSSVGAKSPLSRAGSAAKAASVARSGIPPPMAALDLDVNAPDCEDMCRCAVCMALHPSFYENTAKVMYSMEKLYSIGRKVHLEAKRAAKQGGEMA